jgi:hypothetical protein
VGDYIDAASEEVTRLTLPVSPPFIRNPNAAPGEAGAYHSKQDPGPWLYRLPSSRAGHNFARSLLPRARAGLLPGSRVARGEILATRPWPPSARAPTEASSWLLRPENTNEIEELWRGGRDSKAPRKPPTS